MRVPVWLAVLSGWVLLGLPASRTRTTNMQYTPRRQFVDFHNRHQRWAVLCTHRRAGKTVALVNDLIYGALECPLHRPQIAYLGPTYRQTKRIAWPYLKEYAAPYLSAPPSESELSVTLHGDRKIFCLGADNPDSLRGMYLDGGAGDEYALFKPSVFSQIIRPALSDRNGWWVFTSTPRGKNLFWEEHRKALANPDEYYDLVLPADTSGIIPSEELEDLRLHMDPEEFAQEYLCSFDSALKGAIYADEVNSLFMEARLKAGLYDPELPLYVVFDLGFTDATVAIYWQEGPDGTIRVVRVHATTGVDIYTHIDDLNELRTTPETIWLPHDARARNLQTGRSMVELFLKEGFRPKIGPSHKVRDRIAAVRRMMPRVWVDPDTTGDLIEALKSYRRAWNDKTLRYDDIPLHDWASDFADSFGYMAMVAQQGRIAQSIIRTPEEAKLGYQLDELWKTLRPRIGRDARRFH